MMVLSVSIKKAAFIRPRPLCIIHRIFSLRSKTDADRLGGIPPP